MLVAELGFKPAYLAQETAFLTSLCHLVPLLASRSQCTLLSFREAFYDHPYLNQEPRPRVFQCSNDFPDHSKYLPELELAQSQHSAGAQQVTVDKPESEPSRPHPCWYRVLLLAATARLSQADCEDQLDVVTSNKSQSSTWPQEAPYGITHLLLSSLPALYQRTLAKRADAAYENTKPNLSQSNPGNPGH